MAFLTLDHLFIITWTTLNSMMHNMFKMNPTKHLSKIKIFKLLANNKSRAQSVADLGFVRHIRIRDQEHLATHQVQH